MSTSSITYIPDASHRNRGIAKSIKRLGKDHPLVKQILESALVVSSKITSPKNIDEWVAAHDAEMRAVLWDARNEYGMIKQKDGIQTLEDALESIFQTFDLTNFLTLETQAAKDIAESIIRLLHTFQGKGSRAEALDSDEFRSLPRMLQQLFRIMWFGNKHKLVPPEDYFELPSLNSEGLIVGGGKVSSHVNADGILQLMNNAESVAAAAAPVVLAPTSGGGIGLRSNATQSTQQASEVYLPEEKENSKRVSFDNMEVESPINKRKPDSPLSYNQQRQPPRRMGHCADVECNKLEWLEPCRHCGNWVCDECTEINCCMACPWLDEPLVMKY